MILKATARDDPHASHALAFNRWIRPGLRFDNTDGNGQRQVRTQMVGYLADYIVRQR
jgi:hypothetical protein